MPSGIVTLQNGRRVKVNAPTREKLIEAASRLSSGAQSVQSGLGIDPNTGGYDEGLADVDRLMSAKNLPTSLPDRGFFGNLAQDLRNIDQETSLPIVGATLASIAFPPLAGAGVAGAIPSAGRIASSLRGVVGRDVTLPVIGKAANAIGQRMISMTPPVAAGAVGGAAGGALAEANQEGATAESIAMTALESGSEMAMAELAGLGLSAAASRVIAPNLKFLDPLKGVRESVHRFIGEKWPKGMTALDMGIAWRGLTQTQRDKLPAPMREAIEEIAGLGERIQSVGRKAARFAATPTGGEVAEMLTVPAIALFFGPGTALAFSVGKALLHPGPIARYLARDKLPSELTRTIGRQAVTLEARRRAGTEEDL